MNMSILAPAARPFTNITTVLPLLCFFFTTVTAICIYFVCLLVSCLLSPTRMEVS